jgi:ABC-2 type transport system permease protein
MSDATRAPRAARQHPARVVALTEARLFLREPGAIFWIMAFPALLLLILGAIPDFREPTDDLDGRRVIDLYVPITVLLSAIMSGVQAMPAVLAAYREQGVLRRIATTPARPAHLLLAQYALHGGAVVVGALIVTAVGWAVYDVSVPGSLGAYALVLALALGACLAIGGVVSGLARTTKIAAALGTIIFLPMMFTAGVWLPVQAMPGLLQDVVELTPLGAAARGLDAAAIGDWPDVRHVATLLVWTLGLGGLAARYFRWE